MKKFLDILLIVLLTILVINLFSSKDIKKIDDSVLVSSTENTYTIPASVWIKIQNNTSSWISLNTCEDLKIKYLGDYIKFDSSMCKDINIASLTGTIIDFSNDYDKFENIWKYTLTLNLNGKEYIEQFEIENSWTFKKLFIWLFYAPIYNLMIFLLSIFNWVFWWAIITITFIIRIILLWPQHKMMVSQKKLQAIQPKIKEIQEKYKWQQQVLWMKLIELYKTEKVNPMGSCGFLIIQMPILFVIYHIILSIKDPSNFFFTYSVLSNFDLSSIDYNFFWLNLLSSWGVSWAILALTVALIQFFQIKLSLAWNKNDKKWVVLEKKKWDNWYSQFMPDPELMNKFMLYWIPVMVWIFTYILFAWIGIYWWISTLFMLVQQYIVNKKLSK